MKKEKMKILIVDDQSSIRDLLKLVLREHDLVEACDGLEAQKLLAEFQPDLLLTDLNMPKCTGWELLQVDAVKDMIAKKRVLVVSSDAHRKDKPVPEGVHRFGKPFSLKALNDLVEQIMKEVA